MWWNAGTPGFQCTKAYAAGAGNWLIWWEWWGHHILSEAEHPGVLDLSSLQRIQEPRKRGKGPEGALWEHKVITFCVWKYLLVDSLFFQETRHRHQTLFEDPWVNLRERHGKGEWQVPLVGMGGASQCWAGSLKPQSPNLWSSVCRH